MSSDTPRPKTCKSTGIFAELMLICSQVYRLPDFILLKIVSSTGDNFYIIDRTKEIENLISEDTEEVKLTSVFSNSGLHFFPVDIVRGLFQSPCMMSSGFIISGSKTIEIVSPEQTSTSYMIVDEDSCTDIVDSYPVPYLLVDFLVFKAKGCDFLDTLAERNVKLSDTLCRLFYAGFHDGKKIPSELEEQILEFMCKHSNGIKALIDQQADDIKCGDAFKRKQRKCKIDQLTKLMLIQYECLQTLREVNCQMKELLSKLCGIPCPVAQPVEECAEEDDACSSDEEE